MRPIHLLVFIHGLWGEPEHLGEAARIIQERASNECREDDVAFRVLLAKSNSAGSTYDGVDWGAERIAKEIEDEIAILVADDKQVVRFSVAGYSMGGLIARYVIGILHKRDLFKDVIPVNFTTFTTPHLGMPRYPSFVASAQYALGPIFLSRSGEQMWLTDKFANERPLLDIMADPDWVFYQALSMFRRIRVYANGVNDTAVPYLSGAIEVVDPFINYLTSGIVVELKDKYAPLIESYTLPSGPVPAPIIFSKSWLRRVVRPVLPPGWEMPLPLTILLYSSAPIVLPFIGISAVTHFTIQSQSSKARLRKLTNGEIEKTLAYRLSQAGVLPTTTTSDTTSTTVTTTQPITVVAETEDPSSSSTQPVVEGFDFEGQTALTTTTLPPQAVDGGETARTLTPSSLPLDKTKTVAILTPLQVRIAESLNKLPIQKETAYFPDVSNSHEIIVCKDAKRFESHKVGEGVLRHWADTFEF